MYNELQRNELLQNKFFAERKQRYEDQADNARLAEEAKSGKAKKTRASIALAIITGAR